MSGHSVATPSESSELSGLVRPEARHMSLPAAMNALRRGEIEYPHDDGSLTGLVSGVSAVPTHRPPKETDLSREIDEQRAQDRIDRQEMLARIHDRRSRADAAAARRLDAAERQLLER